MLFPKIAWRNLFLHRRKSLSALLAIMMAFGALSLFEAYIHDVKQLYNITFAKRQMLGSLVIEKAKNPHPGKASIDGGALDARAQAWIDDYLGVEQHAGRVFTRVRFLNIAGFVASRSFQDVFIGLAFDPREGAAMRAPDFSWSTYAGVPLDQGTPASLLLGSGLATLLSCRGAGESPPGALGYVAENRPFSCEESEVQLQATTQGGQSNSMDLTIDGLISTGFAELDAHMLMIPLETAQKLFDTDLVSYYSVQLAPGVELGPWLETLHRAAAREGIAIEGRGWREHPTFGELYRRSLKFLELFRGFIISIILVVVVMAIMNNFLRIVHERRHEIGTLRSLGYRPHHVLAIFAWEALFLAVIGSCAGVLFAYAAAALAGRLGILYDAGFLSEGVPFRVALEAGDFVWIAFLLVGLTLGATTFAAWRACRSNLAELLPKT